MAEVCQGTLNYVDIKKNLLPEVGEVPEELLWQALQLVVVNVEPLKHKKNISLKKCPLLALVVTIEEHSEHQLTSRRGEEETASWARLSNRLCARLSTVSLLRVARLWEDRTVRRLWSRYSVSRC